MKKQYIIGGLAIVGAIALFMYLKPKAKVNSEGFYGASGEKKYVSSGSDDGRTSPPRSMGGRG
jgi:hypothetical protein